MLTTFFRRPQLLSRLLAVGCLSFALHVAHAGESLGPEMLVNGSFKDGKVPWKLETLEGAQAEWTADGTAFQGHPAAVVSVGSGGADSKLWAVQLYQADLTVRKDRKYRVTFQAKSDPAKWMFVTLSETVAPYGVLTKGSQVELGDDWKLFTYDFVATKDSDSARLLFTNLNLPGAKRCVAEVSLKEIR